MDGNTEDPELDALLLVLRQEPHGPFGLEIGPDDQERFQVRLWEAINEYAAACGGDTSAATISDRRMNAVAQVGRVLRSQQTGRETLPLDVSERLQSLRRAMHYGIEHGKRNMIVDIDLLEALFVVGFPVAASK